MERRPYSFFCEKKNPRCLRIAGIATAAVEVAGEVAGGGEVAAGGGQRGGDEAERHGDGAMRRDDPPTLADDLRDGGTAEQVGEEEQRSSVGQQSAEEVDPRWVALFKRVRKYLPSRRGMHNGTDGIIANGKSREWPCWSGS